MTWQEAVKNLFASHPPAMGSQLVIDTIEQALGKGLLLSQRDLAAEQNRSYNIGADRQQLRILELLENHGNAGWCGEPNCPGPFPTKHLAELIKGEQK